MVLWRLTCSMLRQAQEMNNMPELYVEKGQTLITPIKNFLTKIFINKMNVVFVNLCSWFWFNMAIKIIFKSNPHLCTVNSRSIIIGKCLASDSRDITTVCNQSECDVCTIDSFWDAGWPCSCDRSLPVSLGATWLWGRHSWSDNHLGIYLSGFPPQPNSE